MQTLIATPLTGDLQQPPDGPREVRSGHRYPFHSSLNGLFSALICHLASSSCVEYDVTRNTLCLCLCSSELCGHSVDKTWWNRFACWVGAGSIFCGGTGMQQRACVPPLILPVVVKPSGPFHLETFGSFCCVMCELNITFCRGLWLRGDTLPRSCEEKRADSETLRPAFRSLQSHVVLWLAFCMPPRVFRDPSLRLILSFIYVHAVCPLPLSHRCHPLCFRSTLTSSERSSASAKRPKRGRRFFGGGRGARGGARRTVVSSPPCSGQSCSGCFQ